MNNVSVSRLVFGKPGFNLGRKRAISQEQNAPLEPDDIEDVDKKCPDEKQQNQLKANCQKGQRVEIRKAVAIDP